MNIKYQYERYSTLILAGFDLYFLDPIYFKLQFSALCVFPLALFNILL